jgi:hypothetical protein
MAILGSNSVTGVTTATATTDVVNRDYIDHRSPLPIQTGNSGAYLSTNGIGVSYVTTSNSQEFTTTGAQTFTVPANATIFYIECVGSGSGGGGSASGGLLGIEGGGAGSYTSWYVHRSLVSSNMTVTVGVGGVGGTGGSGTTNAGIGQSTTVSWTGPESITYTLTSLGGGAAGAAGTSQIFSSGGRSSYFYTVAGGAGGAVAPAVAIAQTGQYQPTGGGGGGNLNANGSAGGSISYYGNTISASGGTVGSVNGSSATAITGLSYGYGGGGGYGNSGNGGNGVRGGGGGGGGAPSGNGGSGGNGYVKITWW